MKINNIVNLRDMPKKAISLCIALILITPAYITFFDTRFNIPLSNTLQLIGFIILVTLALAMTLKRKVRYDMKLLIFQIIILGIFVFSYKNFKIAKYTFLQLGFYFIIPTIVMQQEFDFEKVLRYIIYFSLPLIFGIESMLVITNVGLRQADMYNVYSFVPIIIATLVHIIFFRKSKNLILVIGYILGLYYLYRVGINAVRGFWLEIIIFFVLVVLYFLQKKNAKVIYYYILVIVSVLLIIALINMDSIITTIIYFAQRNLSIDIGILVKTQALLQSGDLSNGRAEIWNQCFQYIASSPIIGYGMESMAFLTDGKYMYPHNLIIQLFMDCGIIVSIYPIYIILQGLRKFLLGVNIKDEQKILMIFFISIGLPNAMLSGDIWKIASLWLMISFFVASFKQIKD